MRFCCWGWEIPGVSSNTADPGVTSECARYSREKASFAEPPQMLSFFLHVRHRRDKNWEDVDQAEKDRLEMKSSEDGEFW